MNTGVFPSGQWGQTVNLLLSASVVRIHPRPPRTPVSKPGTGVSVLSAVQKERKGGFEQHRPAEQSGGEKSPCGAFLDARLATSTRAHQEIAPRNVSFRVLFVCSNPLCITPRKQQNPSGFRTGGLLRLFWKKGRMDKETKVLMQLVQTGNYSPRTAAKPASRSAMMSSMCSVPMDRRMVFW